MSTESSFINVFFIIISPKLWSFPNRMQGAFVAPTTDGTLDVSRLSCDIHLLITPAIHPNYSLAPSCFYCMELFIKLKASVENHAWGIHFIYISQAMVTFHKDINMMND